MNLFANPTRVCRQPELHRAVDIFVVLANHEFTAIDGTQRSAEGTTHSISFGAGDNAAASERCDVAQRSDDIVPQQPRINGAVVPDGVRQHQCVGVGRGRPERASTRHRRYSWQTWP
jgi:hypothetical protein